MAVSVRVRVGVASVTCLVQRSGAERLDRSLPIARADLVAYAPFAETRAGGLATIAELCAAAVGIRDNAAANLLLATAGGPAGRRSVERRCTSSTSGPAEPSPKRSRTAECRPPSGGGRMAEGTTSRSAELARSLSQAGGCPSCSADVTRRGQT